MDLTEPQWRVIGPLLPKPKVRQDKRGRPWRDPRDVLNGILWIMRTGAPWHDLPPRYPPYQTCHRRFQLWVRSGTLRRVLEALARDLAARGGIDLSEGFIDATFAGAKKGGFSSVLLVRARAPKSWPWQTALVFLSPLISQVRPRLSPVLSSRPSPSAT
jgi:transposase